jgi:uncharacterized protein with FMN-binding domain
MKRAVTAAMTAAAVAIPTANAAAAVAKKKVTTVTKRVTGAQGQADRWGYVQLTLVVKKTTTTIGKKKTVARKIVGVTVPVYPNHTDRSVFINQQALPLLVQEVLHAQFNPNVDMISGATDTSYGFIQSLQAAIAAAKKV